ncbi:Crp/Fnr family transcriptional regulator [Brevundimonas sp.]|uniref:Crp/Fnr family transcriptional regulator n=1 Tax=Brevundimonas sp. TaxID=1871086 RepID=UPI003565C723
MDHRPDNPLLLMVQAFQKQGSLSEDDLNALLSLPAKVRKLEPSSYIVREGDTPNFCCVLKSGLAYRQKQTSGGQRQIVSLNIPGDALDLQHLFLGIADHSVQMMTRGEVVFIPMRELQDVVSHHSGVARAVSLATLVEASVFREWVLNVGRRDARSRLAHLLCEFAFRMRMRGLASGPGYALPITQEQLADALGLTSVHVSRMLKILESEGLLVRNKRNITFESWENLREIADFNPRYLHFLDS